MTGDEEKEILDLLRGASERNQSILNQQRRDGILNQEGREVVVPNASQPASNVQPIVKRRRFMRGSSKLPKYAAPAGASGMATVRTETPDDQDSAFAWKSAWLGLAGALGAAVIGGAFAIGGQVIDTMNPPAPTSDTRTVCASAYENVQAVLDLGVDDPDLLRRVNSAEVDAECGDEAAIAEDIENGP